MPMKILAPGGSFSQIQAAVASGADAVYVGVPGFNARRMISGNDAISTMSDLLNCIDWVHDRGKEIHCALNIIIKDGEFAKAFQSAELLHRSGIDALIIQDIGLFAALHKEFPELPLHTSTQMGVSGVDGVRYSASLGARCVVLPRETTIDEIRVMKHAIPEIEFETFVHGALCFAFSGQCYYSAFIGGRSGNRGLCGQPCRKVYEHNGKKEHLFSCKDLCLIDDLKELEDAGISYLKIEGRAKDATYTAKIVRSYREALDGVRISANLDYVFNRGYTKGLILHDPETLNTAYISHKGVPIGTIGILTDDTMDIITTETIAAGDGLFFPAINTGCCVETTVKNKNGWRITPALPRVKTGDAVYKNRDALQDASVTITSDESIPRKERQYSLKKYEIKQKIIKPECDTIMWIMLDSVEKIDVALSNGFTHFIMTQPLPITTASITVYALEDFGVSASNGKEYGVICVSMDDLGKGMMTNKAAIPFCTVNVTNAQTASIFPKGFFFSWELSSDEILKNRFRHNGIVYIDGPIRLMTTFHTIDEGVYRDEHHTVRAQRKNGFTVIDNGERLLGIDHVPRLWGKVGGLCYNGEKDDIHAFTSRIILYHTIIDKLARNERIHDEKDAVKALAPYTKGLLGEGVV